MEYSLQEVESMDAGYVKVPEDEELLPKVSSNQRIIV
jgi:hypothetical protein